MANGPSCGMARGCGVPPRDYADPRVRHRLCSPPPVLRQLPPQPGLRVCRSITPDSSPQGRYGFFNVIEELMVRTYQLVMPDEPFQKRVRVVPEVDACHNHSQRREQHRLKSAPVGPRSYLGERQVQPLGLDTTVQDLVERPRQRRTSHTRSAIRRSR